MGVLLRWLVTLEACQVQTGLPLLLPFSSILYFLIVFVTLLILHLLPEMENCSLRLNFLAKTGRQTHGPFTPLSTDCVCGGCALVLPAWEIWSW